MLLLQQMIILFILMAVGFFCSKKDILTEETSKKISAIVVNIANPAIILVSGMSDERIEGTELIHLTILILIIYAVLLVLAFLIPVLLRIDQRSRGTYQAMMVFSNIGFMGYPMVSALYGSGAVLYAALYGIPFNILIYTFGVSAMSKNKPSDGSETKKSFSLGKIFNIGMVSSLLSLAIYLIQLPIPDVIYSALDYLGSMTAPLSMMVIGASLASIKIKDLFTDKKLIAFSLIKMVIIPILAMFVIRQFVESEVICGVMLIMLATPVGSMTAMLAQQYDGDYDMAAKGVALTTILAVVTMPIVSMIAM